MKTAVIFLRHIALFLCCIVVTGARAANPAVKLADVPMFNGHSNVHPNLLLSLSVEFPTVGIAYRGSEGYNRTTEYIGYFNAAKCYGYNGGNRNLADQGDLSMDGYFFIVANADRDTHECDGNSFSGNFMNWSASSAIDMLRYALTGGDRVYDVGPTTLLQRAVLPNTGSANFYAHATYFPRRKLTGEGSASAPGKVTPFDTSTLYIVSCSNRILFSDASSGVTGNKDAEKAKTYCSSTFDDNNKEKAETTDKRLGEYLVRVKVCDDSERFTRTALCRQYGNHHKPTGEIQRNADRVRLAAMGYLADDSAARYGGVLRAPMKHVGPAAYEAPGYIEAANSKAEWDAATGVFVTNPDGDSSVNRSGVINYLNQFGRSGIYKRYDPVGELYYEGIRYLQGKSPTAGATSGVISDTMKDRFPVITDWADPVIAACQKNYIVSIADVNTHWDRYIPGNERTTFGDGVDANDSARAVESLDPGKTPELDVKPWTKKVGEQEAETNSNLASLHTRDTGSGGHGTYYMAGLAYWANTNDIRVDKPVRVKTFTIDVDEGGNGLVDGNTRTIPPRESQLYLAAKYGGQIGKEAQSNCEIKSDVPSNYFLASQPKEMIRSIRTVFDSIGGSSGTISGVSASSTRTSSDGAYVFQPGFNSSNWCGSLRKRALRIDSDDMLRIEESAAWDAGEILTGKGEVEPSPKPADRKIYTSGLINGKFQSPIDFKWKQDAEVSLAVLTDAQKALLNTSPTDGADDGRGADRVQYLRGSRTLELGRTGGIFRARASVLGDIINSNPLYVGVPASSIQGDGYQKFRDDHKTRAKAVYVGANDGMLHAFSADTGKELFAYVPNALIAKLGDLTRPDYVHRSYVDGMVAAADVKVGKDWKTVLVSGMGGGAQGAFALDITEPSAFAGSAGALFEFTDADDPDMGNLVSPPLVAKFRLQADKNSAPEYKYFVVLASGLNNYTEDGAANTKATGALFLLSLDKAPGAKWVEKTNYFKFVTPNTDETLQNGLGSPALVVGADGAVRYAYAGDLQGNLWRINFTGTESWSKTPPNVSLLFTAKNGDVRQPITTQPKAVFAPGGGYVVLFGTGKFLEKSDAAPGNFQVQSFYAVRDTTIADYRVDGRGELVKRVLQKEEKGTALEISGDSFSYDDKKGWYFDFLDSAKTGERNVTNGLVIGGLLYLNSLMPGTNPCSGGSGRTYVLSTLSGLSAVGIRTGFLSTVGMLSSPVVFDLSTSLGDRNAIGRRVVTRKSAVVNFGTDGAAPAQFDGLPVPAGRFSWREIVNWLDR